jgi:hypothetical protein
VSLFKDKLQLDKSYKTMIQALVEEHGARGGKNDPDRVKVKDVVEDKGKGLVLLLHGPPGVGKTVSFPQFFYFLFTKLTGLSSQQKPSPRQPGSHSSSSASQKSVSTPQKRSETSSKCST